MRKFVLAAGTILAAGVLTFSSDGKVQLNKSFADSFITGGVEGHIQFRPRFEYVDVDNSTKDAANALTVRTAATVKLKSLFGTKGLNGIIEAVNVGAIIDKYAPQKPQYETVADPPNTRFSQFALTYTTGNTTFIAGRVYVIIDDHRFIGNVAWRQMYQSFGVLAAAGKTGNFNYLVAGIYERKGIKDALNADWRLNKMPIVLDFNYKFSPELRLKAFGYLVTDVHNTYGLKASGKIDLGGAKISYLGEYAKQTDPYAKDNLTSKPDIDTSYYRLAIGGGSGGFFGKLMYTHFGDANDKDKGFSTPLATLHKWDGWADVLLAGAANGFDFGMNEIAVYLGYKKPDIGKFMFVYLRFKSDKDPGAISKDIGKEYDLLYAKKLSKHLSFLAKAAFYKADDGYYTGGSLKGTNDVTKYWLQLNYIY